MFGSREDRLKHLNKRAWPACLKGDLHRTGMKVSRTVFREALMLLEEDRLIRACRGIGRFLSDALPSIGIERIRSFEEVLGRAGQHIEINRVLVVRPSASARPLVEFVGLKPPGCRQI